MATMTQEQEQKGYNGWTNYETWVTALWIDNEQGSYSYSRELAGSALETAQGMDVALRAPFTVEEQARFILTESLKNWHEDAMPELEASVWSDLLRASFSEINWHEIAENYLEELEEN